jgi:hypothetical protein
LRIDGDGAMSLWRTESGSYALQASSAAGTVPAKRKRWIRLALEPDPSGHACASWRRSIRCRRSARS